ncbi:MAG TPA: hypothetical protein VH370_15625 [Humisphaera sp.]|nr:hypothetical protein [Humisphaera sp.]
MAVRKANGIPGTIATVCRSSGLPALRYQNEAEHVYNCSLVAHHRKHVRVPQPFMRKAKKQLQSKSKAGDLPGFSNAGEFAALSAADKEKVWNYYNRRIPLSETRPLNARERAQFERTRRRSVRRPVT